LVTFFYDTYRIIILEIMPFRVVCRRCGHVLWESVNPVPLSDIVGFYGGRCPRCFSVLRLEPPLDVEVRPSTMAEELPRIREREREYMRKLSKYKRERWKRMHRKHGK